MRGFADPLLLQLRAARMALKLAQRERPASIRSALAERRGHLEPADDVINAAVILIDAVGYISSPKPRETVFLSMAVHRGEPLFDRARLARRLRVSEKTVTRWLIAGLDDVRRQLMAFLETAQETRNDDLKAT